MTFRANTSKLSLIYVALVLCLALVIAVATSAESAGETVPVRPSNLHQWGAVTLFHGLPSDRVRAIAQDGEGVMWFGTDAGLAKYDGRRTQTVADAALASRRVLALRFDGAGALWIGTDAGALRMTAGGERFVPVAETGGKTVTAIAVAAEGGRVVLATNAGALFDCRPRPDGSLDVRVLPERPLDGGGADKSQPLELTSVAIEGESVLVGTRGRGLVRVEGGAATEVASRPRVFYVETLERDARGHVWFGAQTTAADSGLFEAGTLAVDPDAPAPPGVSKFAAGATGTVSTLKFDARGDMWAGTDGQGVFRFRGAQRLERFTFEGTAGGLRSNRVYSIFVDREGVAWFGTDRGVCRYDPHGVRNETVAASDAESNFVRVLFQTSTGKLLAGTNRGLFARSPDGGAWRAVEGMTGKTVYAVAEDPRGRVLVGAASGLYVGAQVSPRAAGDIRFAPEEKPPVPTATRPTPSADDDGTREDGDSTLKVGVPFRKAGLETGADAPAPPLENETATGAGTTAEPAVVGNVRAVALFQSATYIASYGRGLERLDGDGLQRRTPVWPPAEADTRTREVISLHADPGGKLWIGTARAGVFFFDGQTVQTDAAFAELADATVRSMSGTGSSSDGGGGGALWLATGRGLYVYRAGKLAAVAPGIDARSVIASDASDSSEAREAASSSAPGASPQPAAPRPASSPQAWCATRGGGLLRIMLDDEFGAVVARLDAEQGLASQSAFAVLPLPGRGGQTGVEEALLIGTSRGVARYEPGRVMPVLRAARVTASRTYAPAELRRGIQLDHPQNGLVLDVSATSSRTFPEQFQYAFLLRNDKGEIIRRKLARDAQFQIDDLTPGAYRVEARAFSNDLVASVPLAFDINVARAPFPWTTAALSVLLLLSLVALMWGTWQNRKIARTGSALAQVNRQLAAARLQLANETEAERRRIARDLHDQTLADLRRLLLLADEMPTDDGGAAAGNGGRTPQQPGRTPALDPPMLRAEIESISNEIRRICEDLSPSVLENAGFAAALEWAIAERVAHLPADCKFTYEFTCADDIEERLPLPRGVQMQIYRIVQEAVSNVCRHAAATHVRLAVRVTDDNDFLLELEDDGRGFDPRNKKARRGRGLANIRARASIIEAQAHWNKRPDGGTTFTLRKANIAAVLSVAG